MVVGVTIYVSTLKEVFNVLVTVVLHWIMMEELV